MSIPYGRGFSREMVGNLGEIVGNLGEIVGQEFSNDVTIMVIFPLLLNDDIFRGKSREDEFELKALIMTRLSKIG